MTKKIYLIIFIEIILIGLFFYRDYKKTLNNVEKTLIDFSQEKEKLVSQFLIKEGYSLQFKDSQKLINNIVITNNDQEIKLNNLRKILYVEFQQKFRLNAYLVNNKGALLTAQENFDTSNTRLNTKIIRNELVDECLNNNSNQNFYTGIDEGNRSVFGTYQKISNPLPLCLFSETEKVTNIDIPVQLLLKNYIVTGLIILALTFCLFFFKKEKWMLNINKLIQIIIFLVTLIIMSAIVCSLTIGLNNFSISRHIFSSILSTLSLSPLITHWFYKSKKIKIGSILLGLFFMLSLFFEDYRQVYSLTNETRNLILIILRGLNITGFLLILIGFKKEAKI